MGGLLAPRKFLVFLLGQGAWSCSGSHGEPPLSEGLGIRTLGWVRPLRGLKGVAGTEETL